MSLRPLELPPITVELDATPHQLQQMLARIEREFTALGQTDPHWSVLSTERFRAANIADNVTEFFASGEYPANVMMAAMARSGLRPGGVCFELGCGLGRITAWLAKRFDRVIACDISAQHLRIARDEMARRNIHNVELVHLNRVDAILDLPPFDAFYSAIALQHNPPPIMRRLLRHVFCRLPSGGAACFQVPTYRVGYRFSVSEYLDSPQPEVEMHVLPQPALNRLIRECGCLLLEIREDDAAPGSISNFVTVTRT